jgi:predicted nucleic acid-binding protein
MIGLDANFLIACELREHQHHEAVHEVLDSLMMEGERFAIAPQVLAEYLHIVTDGRRLKNPQTMPQALERAELWRTATEVDLLFPNDRALELFFSWMNQFQLGRKRVLDTMLAATLATAGIVRVATIDVRDFAVFGVFDCVTPRKK